MNSIQHATREELSASTQLVADFVKHTLDTITVERLGDHLSEETSLLAFAGGGDSRLNYHLLQRRMIEGQLVERAPNPANELAFYQ